MFLTKRHKLKVLKLKDAVFNLLCVSPHAVNESGEWCLFDYCGGVFERAFDVLGIYC